MKTTTAISALALAIGLFAAAPALAEDALDVSYNIGVTSDYVFRGVSQTDEKPAVQGGVDLTYKSLYVGAWASNVDFGDSTDGEVDFYAGVRPEVQGYAFDFGVYAYLYPGGPSSAHWNYWEAKAAVSREVGPVTLGGALYWSPEYAGKTGSALYSELNAAWKLNDKFTASGAFGRQEIADVDGYNTWNAGVAFAITSAVSIDVRYWDTDEHGFGDIYGSRGVISLKGAF